MTKNFVKLALNPWEGAPNVVTRIGAREQMAHTTLNAYISVILLLFAINGSIINKTTLILYKNNSFNQNYET